MNRFKFTLFLTLLTALVSCSKSSSDSTSSSTEDSSASGAAASAVGSALSGSTSSGTQAFYDGRHLLKNIFLPEAFASTTCPTVLTASGSGCTQNGNAADLTYSSCSFGSSSATWSGTLEFSLSSGTAVSCGTFPTVSSIANGQSIQRQFVSSGSPGTATRTSAFGTTITVDHSSSNLSNFDTGTTIAANIGSGYGLQVVFDGSGHRKQVVVDQRIYSSKFDHSITGSVNLTESGTTRTITSGTLTVYHNKLRVVGTASFSNVVYNDTCSTPVSGTITTTFAAGAHVTPTALGSAVVGKSETLTFNSCGSQTLKDTSGSSSSVALSGI